MLPCLTEWERGSSGFTPLPIPTADRTSVATQAFAAGRSDVEDADDCFRDMKGSFLTAAETAAVPGENAELSLCRQPARKEKNLLPPSTSLHTSAPFFLLSEIFQLQLKRRC